jgi:hypothetical protein
MRRVRGGVGRSKKQVRCSSGSTSGCTATGDMLTEHPGHSYCLQNAQGVLEVLEKCDEADAS